MARAVFHDAVVIALQKEGWIITDDPFRFKIGGVEFLIDLFAEKEVIAAQKGAEKIAVEIKTFIGNSRVSSFHTAIGQYINYRAALGKDKPNRVLYLAVPDEVYDTFFQLPFVEEQVKACNINLLIYNIEEQKIITWNA